MEQSQDTRVAYIVQGEQKLGVQELLDLKEGKELDSPDTVCVPSIDWFRRLTKPDIMSELVKKGYVLEEEEISRWGLRNGDEISINSGDKIAAVNGFTSAKIMRERPHIIGVGALIPDYPTKRIPIEQYGNDTMKAFSLIAPIGKGQRGAIASPPDTGKTYTLRAAYEACHYMLAVDKKLYLIAVQVGERHEDTLAMMRIKERVLKLIEKKAPDAAQRSELYWSPDGDPEEAHYYLTEYVFERARRLCECGYDVILFVDSMSRVLLSHSRAVKIIKPKNDAPAAKGVSNYSHAMIKRLLSVAGNFGDRSLTILATMLTDGFGGIKSSESILFNEIGPSAATLMWVLINNDKINHPKIHVSQSGTREIVRMCEKKHIDKMRYTREQMWSAGGKSYQAVNKLMEIAPTEPTADWIIELAGAEYSVVG